MADGKLPCCVVSASTKRARHAYMPGCSPVLKFLAARLHLFSFILSDDSIMLSHFLRHYHRLGVSASHTRVAIRARRSGNPAALNDTLSALDRAGVPRDNVRVVHSAPSDALKIQLMNEQIKSLALDDWFIYADVDELFDYPCELHGAIERNKFCFAGLMWDQMAANGRITEMRATPDVGLQYPLQCRIRATLGRHLKTTKVILHRVSTLKVSATENFTSTAWDGNRTYFRTTHDIKGPTFAASRCAVRGIVRHFTMTSQQLASNAQKATDYRMPTGSLNYANATCGQADPRTGKCLDYAILQRFMETLSNVRNLSALISARSTIGGGSEPNASHLLSRTTNPTMAHVARLCPLSILHMSKGEPCSPRNPSDCR